MPSGVDGFGDDSLAASIVDVDVFDSLHAAARHAVQAFEGTRRKTFQYLYDFGDGWDHSVKIERIEPADPLLRLSMMTTSPAESVGTRNCST